MNLSEVRTKLYKVKISNIPSQDEFGIHIGDNMPPRDFKMPIPSIDDLYVAGKDTKDAVDFLTSHNINILQIEEVSVLEEHEGYRTIRIEILEK